MIALGAPFVFGFAKPVPVNPARLHNPRRDMVLVALAGPGMNIVLACLSALLLHAAAILPPSVAEWWRVTFTLGIAINLVLAIFNMLPVPPLDGGRVVHGLLPPRHAERFARLERFGIIAVLVGFFLVPFVAAEFRQRVQPVCRDRAATDGSGLRADCRVAPCARHWWHGPCDAVRRRCRRAGCARVRSRRRRGRARADRQSRRVRGAARPPAHARPRPEGRSRPHLHPGAGRAVSGLYRSGAAAEHRACGRLSGHGGVARLPQVAAAASRRGTGRRGAERPRDGRGAGLPAAPPGRHARCVGGADGAPATRPGCLRRRCPSRA